MFHPPLSSLPCPTLLSSPAALSLRCLAVKLAAKDAYSYYLYKTPGFIEDGLLDNLPKELLYKLLQQSFYREIQHITLFRTSDIAFVAQLLVHGRALQIATGELVYDCGDIAEDMAFIIRGNVRLLVDEGSRDTLVGYASHGGYFGDFEYYQRSTTRIARYQAVQNTTLMSIDYHWIALAVDNNPEAGSKFQQELKNRFNLFQIVTRAPVLALSSGHAHVDPRDSPPRSPPSGLAPLGMPSLADTVHWFKASVQFNREGSKRISQLEGMQNNNSNNSEEHGKGGEHRSANGRGTSSNLKSSGRSVRRKSSLFGPLTQQLDAAELARTLKENFQKFFNGRMVQRRDRIWTDGMVKLETGFDEEEESRIHDHDIRYPVMRLGTHSDKGVEVVGYVTTEMTAKEVRAQWLIHPEDRVKQVWDGFMGILIIYSVVILPMEMAFQMQDNVTDDGSRALQHLWGLSMFDFAVDGLFFFDICLSFQTTYFSDAYDAYIGTTTHFSVLLLILTFVHDINNIISNIYPLFRPNLTILPCPAMMRWMDGTLSFMGIQLLVALTYMRTHTHLTPSDAPIVPLT